MLDMTDKARIFATAAHAAVGQKRKHTGEDYIVHPTAVATTVGNFFSHRTSLFRDRHIAAAFLHDVVEDTHITLDQIKDLFGREVHDIVEALTDVPFVEGGPNRKARKAMDRDRLAQADAGTQTIKVADLIDTTKTIVEFDPKFAVVYLAEKALLLDVLTKADPALLAQARGQIDG